MTSTINVDRRLGMDTKDKLNVLVQLANYPGFADAKTQMVRSQGSYLLLHHDLDTTATSRPTASVYDNVKGLVLAADGYRLSDSVYLVPVPSNTTPEAYSKVFWNVLATTTGKLAGGDSFFVHFSTSGKVGEIAQVVPPGAIRLTDVPLP